jgi:hypothetical protein
MLGEIIYQNIQIVFNSMDYDAGQIEMLQFVIKCSCFEQSHPIHGKWFVTINSTLCIEENSLLYFLIVTPKFYIAPICKMETTHKISI